MIALLMLLATAQAQDPVFVPAGDSVTAEVPSYLLPEPMLDECLSAKRKLKELLEPALESCIGVCDSALTTAQTSLSNCRDQLELDGTKVTELLGHEAVLEAQIVRLRSQRNIAWAIAGSLVTGSIAAIWVTTQIPVK